MKPMTRRQLLTAAGLTAAGIPLTGSMARSMERLVPAPAVTTTLPLAGPTLDALAPVQPLSLTADSTLSEDHFLSDQVQADPSTDTIVPVLRSDGATVVLMLSQGVVSLVRPDPAAPSGYLNTAVTGADLGTVSFLDAVPGPSGSVVISYASGLTLTTAVVDVNGVAAAPRAAPLPSGFLTFGPLQASVAADGQAAFAALIANSATYDYGTGFAILFVDPVSGSTTLVNLETSGFAQQQYTINSASALLATMGGIRFLVGALVTQTLGLQLMLGVLGTDIVPTTVTAPGGAYLSPQALLADPIVTVDPSGDSLTFRLLWTDANGNAFAGACGGNGVLSSAPIPLLSATGSGFALDAGPVTTAQWFLDPTTGLVTAYLVAGGTLYIQTIDVAAGTADTPVPLETGILGAYQPGRPLSPVTSLIVATPSPTLVDQPVLATLARRTGTGVWQVTPLATTAPSNVEIDTYRTLLTVTDATGAPVPGVELAVTPKLDLDVIAFHPTGAQRLPSGMTTFLTTDTWGQVSLATPATVLYACPLSVQLGSAAAVTVNPDKELHTFLQGQGTISSYPTVSAALAANAGTGKNLPNLPTDSGSINAVAQAITGAMAAGAATSGGIQPLTFTLSGLATHTPSLATTARPRLRAGDSPWWDDVKHDLESAWHAVEHGVAKVATVVSGYDQTLKQWFVQLDIAIDNYVSATIEYAITDLRSAVVAVHGILQALGADIRAAISFLRTLVSDVFKDAVTIADYLQTWFLFDENDQSTQTQGLGLAYQQVPGFGAAIKSDINGLAAKITGLLGQTGSTGSSTTIAGAKATTQPTPTKTSAAGAHSNVKATYLLDKTRHTTTPGPASSSATTAGVSTLLSNPVSAHETSAQTSGASAATTAAGGSSDPHSLLSSLSLADIAALVATIVDDVAALLDDLVDDLFALVQQTLVDLKNLLSINLDDLPFVGDLLSKLGDGQPLTIARLFCLILGFTMAVIGDILFLGQSWLPTAIQSTRKRLPTSAAVVGATSTGEAFLAIGNLVLSILAGVVTLASDLDYEKGEDSPGFLDGLGVFTGSALNLLAFPFTTNSSGLSWTPQQTDAAAPFGTSTPIYQWVGGFLGPVFDGAAAIGARSQGPRPDRLVDVLLPLVDAFFGALLIAGAVYIAKATDQDAEAEAGALIAAIPMCTRILRLTPVTSVPSWASVVFDVASPAALAVLALVALGTPG